MSWPAKYKPVLPGFAVLRVDEGAKQDWSQPPLLGVRLDKYAKTAKKQSVLFDGPIQVTMVNAGGSSDGAMTIGGCLVYYEPIKVDGQWTVKCKGILDP
jgi:hypothetical protein